jgi:hypothetical protein
MKRIPIFFQFALRTVLRLRRPDFDLLASHVEAYVEGQDPIAGKSGIEKAQTVVQAVRPLVPESHAALANQIIRLLIEIVLISARK